MRSAHTLREWAEEPRDLIELMAWAAVQDRHAGNTVIEWKGATKEPFLSRQRDGWVKMEYVLRLTRRKVTVHFWQSQRGVRAHLKVKTT